MINYLLKCTKCGKSSEALCNYEDIAKMKCVFCKGQLRVDISKVNVSTRVRGVKKYYRNIGGTTETNQVKK